MGNKLQMDIIGGIIENLENQFYNIFHLLDQHKYAEKEYKDALDKLKLEF